MPLQRSKDKAAAAEPATTRSRSSSESSIDESFFLRTYVPLSNLPTPPLGYSNNSTRQQSPEVLFPGESLDPELLGPAVHLINLIPSSTSLTPASIPLVQSMLAHANLPLETVALAVCILDSLNSRFALAFRHGVPLTPPPARNSSYFHTEKAKHVDSIHPELLILSALVLAAKYLDDEQQTTAKYASAWGKEIWTCKQINYAQRSILENIGYKIFSLWDKEIISDALRDMKLAGQQYEPQIYDDEDTVMQEKENMVPLEGSQPLGNGKAVLGSEKQMTSAEIPSVKDFPAMKELSLETKEDLSAEDNDSPNKPI